MNKREEAIELLLSGGYEAEKILQGLDADPDFVKYVARVEARGGEVSYGELEDHVSCLSCSETLSDARANAEAALAWIAQQPSGMRRVLKEVKEHLEEALSESLQLVP